MPAKGQFDVKQFQEKLEKVVHKGKFEIPNIPYILNDGETLDDAFDKWVTHPPLQRNPAVKNAYIKCSSNAGRGIAMFDVNWIKSNRSLPSNVRTAISMLEIAKYKYRH